jgi:Ca2+/Na+ antiporter
MDNLMDFIVSNKAAIVLAVLLIVVFIWLSVKLRITRKNFNNEKTQLTTQYESKIDTLQINHLEFATEVFSWSVRSELLRNNTENLNQLLTVFVKKSGADLVYLIKPEDKMVLLSSDKKHEGSPYTGDLNFELNTSTILKEDGIVKIITPVMGLNSKIGILIVELRKS